MSEKEFHYRWEYDLRASPQALWPLVSDTNRFNRDAGLPDVSAQAPVEAGGVARRRLKLKRLGVGFEWEEEPFEWVRPFPFGVARRYPKGPVAEMRVAAELSEREGGGTLLVSGSGAGELTLCAATRRSQTCSQTPQAASPPCSPKPRSRASTTRALNSGA